MTQASPDVRKDPHHRVLALVHIHKLLPFRFLLLDCLLHPIAALQSYVPHLNMPLLKSSFRPSTGIQDLSGKVFFITGGQSSFAHVVMLTRE